MAVNCSSGPTLSIFVLTSIHSAMYRRESAVRTAVHKVHSGLFVRKLDKTYMIPHHNSCGVCPRSGEDFGGNLHPIPQIISVPSRAGYFGGKSTVCTTVHRVHSRLFVMKLDMTYMILHHNSWESVPAKAGILAGISQHPNASVQYRCGYLICRVSHVPAPVPGV